MLRPEQGGPTRRILLVTALALSLAHTAILALGSPVLRSRPGWFWPMLDTPLPDIWLILPLGALAAMVGRRVWSEPERARRNLTALVLLGLAWQLGFAMMTGQGIEGARAHLVGSGHAEFVRVAASDLTIRDIATRYEAVLDERALVFPRSKPPGQLLLYAGLERVTGLGLPGVDHAARAARLVAVATWLFPLLTALAALPLYALARRWLGARLALAAVLVFLLAPNTTLITMHLDGVLYPTLATCLLLLATLAAERRHAGLALASGFVYFLCSSVSFSLLPLAMLALAPLMAAARPKRADAARLLAAAGLGAGVPLLSCRLLFDYDPIARFRAAVAFHDHWKRLFVPGTRWDYALSNWLDFGLWVGIPVMGCWLVGTAVAARRSPDVEQVSALLLALLLFGLAWQAGTLGETARLWLFLVPLVAIVAARGLAVAFPTHTGIALSALLAWEAGITLVTKRYQDFF